MKNTDNTSLLFHHLHFNPSSIQTGWPYTHFFSTSNLPVWLHYEVVGMLFLLTCLLMRLILSDDETCRFVVQLELQDHIVGLVCWYLHRLWHFRWIERRDWFLLYVNASIINFSSAWLRRFFFMFQFWKLFIYRTLFFYFHMLIFRNVFPSSD